MLHHRWRASEPGGSSCRRFADNAVYRTTIGGPCNRRRTLAHGSETRLRPPCFAPVFAVFSRGVSRARAGGCARASRASSGAWASPAPRAGPCRRTAGRQVQLEVRMRQQPAAHTLAVDVQHLAAADHEGRDQRTHVRLAGARAVAHVAGAEHRPASHRGLPGKGSDGGGSGVATWAVARNERDSKSANPPRIGGWATDPVALLHPASVTRTHERATSTS